MNRLLIAFLIALSPAALAQNVYDTKGGIAIGAFFPSLDTTVRVDNDTNDIGTDVSLEGDLNFSKDESVFRFQAFWRPAQKHRIFLDYYDIRRDTRYAIQGEITIEDETYAVDTVLNADFDTRIIPIFYEYSLFQSPTTEFGIGGGIHYIDLEFGISEQGTTRGSRSSADGPLPLIGVSLTHLFSPKWRFEGAIQAFSADINDIDGTITSFRLGLDYMFTQNFSVGLGYDFFELDVDLTENDWRGNVNFDYDGANLRLAYRW